MFDLSGIEFAAFVLIEHLVDEVTAIDVGRDELVVKVETASAHARG